MESKLERDTIVKGCLGVSTSSEDKEKMASKQILLKIQM